MTYEQIIGYIDFLIFGPPGLVVVKALGPFAWALIALVAVSAVQSLLIKRPSPRKPEAFEDLEFPAFEEGTRQTVCFGDCWTTGWMVLWYGNYRTTKIKSGGKK